ncbi:hypothetical protein ACEPAI_3173 [Sanghuangporus weigelae]
MTAMTYVAHPYASATPSPSSSPSGGMKTKTRTRPQRPTIITSSSSPASFLDATSPTLRTTSSRSPSPITFARASVINISSLASAAANGNLREKNKMSLGREEKKDRRVGLMGSESQRVGLAGLDALLRVPESACPRAVPQPRMPNVQLVRSATSLSVTPSIVYQPPVRTTSRVDESKISGSGNESDGSSNGSSVSTYIPRGVSPTPSYGSGSGSAPSTPGQPRTPVSIEFKFENDQEKSFSYPTVAPLSICKANRTPSPSPPSKLHPLTTPDVSSSPTPSSTSKENSDSFVDGTVSLRRRRSRGRFSARTAATPRAERLFAPLEIDTNVTQSHNVELPTLTGVLEEFEREALNIPPVPSLPTNNAKVCEKNEEDGKDEDESEWMDIPSNEDGLLEDAEYYRADIASHLQLFSSSSSFPPLSRVPSYTRTGHRRGGSNSSFSSILRWQLPPARPDSMPPPPHFQSSLPSYSRFGEEEVPSLPPLPPLPTLPNEMANHGFLRRASASSLASTASNRSNRSNRSSGSASERRKRRSARRSVAKRSAAAALGRRSNGALGLNRPLPPIPDGEISIKGPSAALDPTFCESLQEEKQANEQSQVRQRPSRSRPPPRFSIPVSVDEDEFGEDVESRIGFGNATGTMTRVVEVDEDENGLIDPFVLERYSVASTAHSRTLPPRETEREGIDPFTSPPQSGRSEGTNGSVDGPLSASTCSRFSPNEYAQQHSQPLLLVPESPAPSSTFGGSGSSNSGETTLTFDAESLYSSYAAFSPAPSSTFPSSCNSDDTNSSFACERKESAQSIYLDASGRPLQSRWSVSTFASTAPPNTSSSARSFFPIPKLVSTVPSRLSARLRASREKAIQQSREREEKERREGKEQPQIVRPFPFFPTPTPPSPKRKTNPGPGKYVPKPDLMPAKERAKLNSESNGKGTVTSGSPRSSIETVKTSSTSSASMSSSSSRSSTRSSSVHTNTTIANANQRPRTPSSPIKAQFAQYHARNAAHNAAHVHFRSVSPTSTTTNSSAASSTLSYSSPPRSMRSSLKSKNSTDSLSAFPFVIGGESLSPLNSVGASGSGSSRTAMVSSCGIGAVKKSEQRSHRTESGSGLWRKVIPPELFA